MPLHLFLDRDAAPCTRSLSSVRCTSAAIDRELLIERLYDRPSRGDVVRGPLAPAQHARRSVGDPMCGSGTLFIEGGLMARQIAPGLQRAESEGLSLTVTRTSTETFGTRSCARDTRAGHMPLQNHGRGRVHAGAAG